jgi:hypothetical protein
MATTTISIPVDDEAPRAFASTSLEQQKKIQLLLSLRLRELTAGPPKPLSVVMDEMSEKARARGLTPAILESLLDET